MTEVVAEVRELLTPVLADKGFDLWDVVYEKQDSDMVLRVLVDRDQGGINMDDLVMLTELIGEQVDLIQPDPFPEAYMMDVSSPGADRALKRDRDFAWAVGKTVQLTLAEPVADTTELVGELLAAEGDALILSVQKKGKRQKVTVSRATIQHAQLALNQDRILTTAEDFAWALNKLVQVTTYKKLDGKKEFAGELTDFTEEALLITQEDEQVVTVPLDAIAKARQTDNF